MDRRSSPHEFPNNHHHRRSWEDHFGGGGGLGGADTPFGFDDRNRNYSPASGSAAAASSHGSSPQSGGAAAGGSSGVGPSGGGGGVASDHPLGSSLLPDSFTSLPVLSESARSRLGKSGIARATFLDYEWVYKRCQRYLGLLTKEKQREKDILDETSTSKDYLQRLPQLGTLSNGRVYVGVSSQSDHALHWQDAHTKAEAHRLALAKEAMAGVSGQERKRWVAVVERGEEGEEEVEEEDATAGGSNGNANGNGPDSSSNPNGSTSKRIPMLGLFAAVDIPSGGWVTEYGGVLEWGGQGANSAKTRAPECNTHVRRIQGSDYVWNGRPWSLLFPRVPSFLVREMKRIGAQAHAQHATSHGGASGGGGRPLDRTRIEPTITNRTLINLLLLLHHEDQPHSQAKSHQLPFTQRDMKNPSLCQGTCLLCRNEMNILLQPLGGRVHVGPLTHDDVLATFLPQCACCSVTVGLLPCEIHAIFSKWRTGDQEALWALCSQVQKQVHQKGGLGYMANTHNKLKQNVKVTNTTQYGNLVRDMYPAQNTYQATRLIHAGEEIYVAYNNSVTRLISAGAGKQ